MAGMTRPRSSNTTETCNDDPNLVHHRRFLGIWTGLCPIRLDPWLQRGRHRPESHQARKRTPPRLQLGTDAVSSIRAHAEQLLKDLADWEPVANANRVDATAASGPIKPQI